MLARSAYVVSTVTGQVAKHGYVNIDGLDSSLGMINAAKLKKIYKWVPILYML
jgi:hypothetical protein